MDHRIEEGLHGSDFERGIGIVLICEKIEYGNKIC